MNFVAYVLGFLAATSNAAANNLQRAANRDESDAEGFSLQLVRDLIRKPVWLAGMACITSSFFLQAAGLGFGTLAGVEPLLVLELPLTMVGSTIWLGSRLDRRAWTGIGAMTASTIALIAFLGPSQGSTAGISWWVWFLAIALTVAVVSGCYLFGLRSHHRVRRSAVLGVGTGAAFGLTAALMKGMTTRFTSGGILGVLQSWQLYTGIAAGVFALWMYQNAVQQARLVIAQPGVTLADPYVSIMWGVTVFGEHTRGGYWLALAILAAATMTVAATVLSQSQQATNPEQAQSGQGGQRGQGGRQV